MCLGVNKIKDILEGSNEKFYQKILIGRDWGNCKNNLYKKAIKDNEYTYYISLFGKNNIQSVYEELYYQLITGFYYKSKYFLKKVFKGYGLNVKSRGITKSWLLHINWRRT